MQRSDGLNKFAEKLKKPRGAFLALVYILTAVLIAISLYSLFVEVESQVLEVLFYVVYGLSAILLGYTVYTIVIYARIIKAWFIRTMKKSRIIEKAIDNYGYRTVIVSTVNTVINVCYVAFNLVIAIIYRSGWYMSLTGYYLLLTAMRSGIVLYHRKKAKGRFVFKKKTAERFTEEEKYQLTELKKYGATGWLLTIMPLFLSFAILLMVKNNRAFIYGGWLVYAVAAHAFYKITMAIINVFRAKNSPDVTVKALRAVGLADALVSILALQTTLLYTFSDGTGSGVANAVTGAVVCAVTFAMGVYVIVKAKTHIKTFNQRKKENGREENGI